MARHDISIPDGSNDTLKIAVSSDGVADIGQRITIPARCGIATRLSKGQVLNIVNPSGHQVCDFFAFAADVEEDCLFIVVFVVYIGSVSDQQFDELDRLLVARDEGGKVEGGLSELCFNSIDECCGVVIPENGFNK